MNDYANKSLNGSIGSSSNTSTTTLMNTTTSGSSPPLNSDSPLRLFGLAKQKINKIFEDINEFLRESDKFINTEGNLVLLNNGKEVDFSTFIEGVKKIIKVLARDHMKVAFFGRTSNGKSTVINSVLHNNILPFGMGHTTNCFLQIEGIESNEAYYVLDNNPDQKLNIDSIHQLANALNSDNIGDDTLCKVYWPKDKCNLLKDDVVLVDSPGIDVSPNLDAWIDKYCMDADVFVLVSNSESTLMRAEKSFFHKVSEKISKPNIFILNNRWDVVVSEGEAEKVKKQHTERSILFLCDELNVISKEEAEERVFFVSAKEVINTRIGGKQAANRLEGYSERYFEFENFERKFEECLSKSAIKTKFNQHTLKGKQMMNDVGKFLDEIEKKSSELKRKKSEVRKAKYDKLMYTEQNFKIITEEIKRNIKHLSSQTETKVSAALNEEIRRLPLLLKDFETPFSDDKLVLSVYKNQLSRFVETGLTANIKARLNDTIYCSVQSSQNEMIQKVAALLPSEDKQKTHYIEFNVKPRESFEILFKLNCESICSDFQEDLEFRFSFGVLTMIMNFMGTNKGKSTVQKSLPPTAPQTPSSGFKDQNYSGGTSNEALSLVSKLIDLSPSSQTTVGALAIGGLMVRTIGVRVLLITCGVYVVVYTYERLTWTNKAKERTFKKQYVNHATRKLNCIVDLTGSNCSHQVQQELSSTFARLCKVVDETITEMRKEINDLEKELNRLDTCLSSIRVLKNKARYCQIELDNFEFKFLREHDDEDD